MKIRQFGPELFDNPKLIINDWYSLAAHTRAYPKYLSRAWGKRDELVKKTPVGKGRITYESLGALKYVQELLHTFLGQFQYDPDMEHFWAYKKGVNPREKVKELVGWKWIVHFDIRKYFDTVDYRHIQEALVAAGFSESGARMLAKYTTVKPGNKSKNTLQQGSPVSGEISNLVGYYHFDREIKALLAELQTRFPRMQYKFARYCDNIFLGLDGDIDISVIQEYQKGCREILQKARFQTHKWNIIPRDHPKRNQKILGIVVNAQARIEKEEFCRVRAILFNCACQGIEPVAEKYFEMHPTDVFDVCVNENIYRQAQAKKFTQYLQGKIAYINSVSEKQGLQLKKLLKVAKTLDKGRRQPEEGLAPDVFNEVKAYKYTAESVEDYIDRVKRTLPPGYLPSEAGAFGHVCSGSNTINNWTTSTPINYTNSWSTYSAV